MKQKQNFFFFFYFQPPTPSFPTFEPFLLLSLLSEVSSGTVTNWISIWYLFIYSLSQMLLAQHICMSYMVFIENLNTGVHRKGHWLISSLILIEFSPLFFLLLPILFFNRYWFLFQICLFICLLAFCCGGGFFYSLTTHEFSVKLQTVLLHQRSVVWSMNLSLGDTAHSSSA